MSKFRQKHVDIEAVTFDELVAHGIAAGGNIVNGMPWSFAYNGHPITHENDNCYLIPTLEGTMRFNRGEMLITGVSGELYPCKANIFTATYDVVSESTHSLQENIHEMTDRGWTVTFPSIVGMRAKEVKATKLVLGKGQHELTRGWVPTAAGQLEDAVERLTMETRKVEREEGIEHC